VYRGYGSAVAARGAVAVMVDHGLRDMASFPAAADVAAAVDLARADPRVDADRIALWFFSGGGLLPIVLTRVGLERPRLAAGVEAFIDAAQECGARLEIIDVPHGQHGFDMLDHTDESRLAVTRALDAVLACL
jgi:acetyl esterase/lipase